MELGIRLILHSSKKGRHIGQRLLVGLTRDISAYTRKAGHLSIRMSAQLKFGQNGKRKLAYGGKVKYWQILVT
jgi:hypothetical protein